MKSGQTASFDILSFLCVLSLVAMSGCGRAPEKQQTKAIQPVKLFRVGAAEKNHSRVYPATVRAAERVKLAFQVPGRIVNFPLKAGAQVEKGDLLGALDSHDYENAYKSALAKYTETKADLVRYTSLVDKKVVSVALYEENRRAYEVAEAEMKIAKKALADTMLLAPFSGVVAATYVDNFQDVQAKKEVLSLQGTGNIELIIYFPEKDVIKFPALMSSHEVIKTINPVAIFPALNGKSFPLILKEFETEADSSIQAFKAIFSMRMPKDSSIMPGMTALVKTDTIDNGEATGYWVPVTAVAEDSNGFDYVWSVNGNNVISQKIVSVGTMSDSRIKVLKGIREGDIIVASGVNFLSEGAKVKEISHMGDRRVALLKAPR